MKLGGKPHAWHDVFPHPHPRHCCVWLFFFLNPPRLLPCQGEVARRAGGVARQSLRGAQRRCNLTPPHTLPTPRLSFRAPRGICPEHPRPTPRHCEEPSDEAISPLRPCAPATANALHLRRVPRLRATLAARAKADIQQPLSAAPHLALMLVTLVSQPPHHKMGSAVSATGPGLRREYRLQTLNTLPG
jgi:hypothetical protein